MVERLFFDVGHLEQFGTLKPKCRDGMGLDGLDGLNQLTIRAPPGQC